MSRYQNGEAAAMNELVRRYKNPVFRYLFRLTANSAEAEELAQDVFLRVHQNRLSYQPQGSFRSWIFSIAHNLYVSAIRKRKWLTPWPRKGADSDEPMDLASPAPSPDLLACAADISITVQQAVQKLPLLQREALILREYEKLEYAEIAKILQAPIGTIKTLIYRAKENLRAELLPIVNEWRNDA
jgi:RNA polymerase sigma-70 factor (ECF subfamily)